MTTPGQHDASCGCGCQRAQAAAEAAKQVATHPGMDAAIRYAAAVYQGHGMLGLDLLLFDLRKAVLKATKHNRPSVEHPAHDCGLTTWDYCAHCGGRV